MNVNEELQRLFYSRLTGDQNIMAIANDVYDDVPDNPFGEKTAYITFGPADTVDDGADCIDGLQITQQIDVWSRTVGFLEAKNLTDMIRKSLHEQDLELTDNAMAELRVVLTNVFRDADGATSHGVVQVTASVQEF